MATYRNEASIRKNNRVDTRTVQVGQRVKWEGHFAILTRISNCYDNELADRAHGYAFLTWEDDGSEQCIEMATLRKCSKV